MRSETRIPTTTDSALNYHCIGCHQKLELESVAAFVRTVKFTDFEPWCARCFLRIVEWALPTAELTVAIEDAFKS